MTFHIYHLIDPHDGAVRYVGRCTDPKARLRNHCNESQRRQTTAKLRWIASLMQANTLPALIVVSTHTNPEQARNAEHSEMIKHKTTIYNVFDPLKFPAVIAKKGKK